MKISVLSVTVMTSVTLVACGGHNASIDTLPLMTAAPTAAPTSVGSTTSLPVAEEFYTIQSGDTLFGIAQAFGVSVGDLISFNAIADPDAIQAGQRLQIPPAATPTTTAPTTTAAPTTP